MQLEITTVELIDLKALRDRLDRERRMSHKGEGQGTLRSNDADRDFEAVDRVVRRAEGGK